jgi:isovaleryl-CoA dehydrogenase
MSISWPALNFDLGADIDMLRDTVAAFCAAEDLWRKFGELGLLGMTVAEQYGGSGMGYLAHAVAMEEVSRASASVGLSYGAHSNLCVNQIHRNGSEAQKSRYLPQLVSGEHVGALAMSEPNAGSDVVSMRLRAEKRATATCSTATRCGSPTAPTPHLRDLRQDRSRGRLRGITAFIVERDFPGFSRAQKLDKLGMRGSNTCELVFEDCEVPAANVLGQERRVAVLMSGLDYERVVLAGGPVGIMQACSTWSCPMCTSASSSASHRRVPAGAGQARRHVRDAQRQSRLVYAVAKACDRNETSAQGRRRVILYTAEAATQMALDAIQCLGGNGYINDYPTGRLLRDAKLYEIGAGTSEIRRMLIGRELFNETR